MSHPVVFISSTAEDLGAYRAAAKKGVLAFLVDEDIDGPSRISRSRAERMARAPSPPARDPGPYLKALRDDTGFIEIRGLRARKGQANRFPIDDLYVPLVKSRTPAPAGAHSGRALPERGHAGRDSGLGNVNEWVADWYAEQYLKEKRNPTGPETGEHRVLRGDSWYYAPEYLRASFRTWYEPENRNYDFGFRCARDV
jgi:hypothetical protein